MSWPASFGVGVLTGVVAGMLATIAGRFSLVFRTLKFDLHFSP